MALSVSVEPGEIAVPCEISASVAFLSSLEALDGISAIDAVIASTAGGVGAVSAATSNPARFSVLGERSTSTKSSTNDTSMDFPIIFNGVSL